MPILEEQVYESTDPRDHGREVEVVEVRGWKITVRNVLTGRRSTVSQHRFGHAYRLVRDPRKDSIHHEEGRK